VTAGPVCPAHYSTAQVLTCRRCLAWLRGRLKALERLDHEAAAR
jgi:hypothetical protein